MSQKIDLTLPQQEYSSLLDMAIDDLRSPSDEIRYILRKEIKWRLSKDVNNDSGENDNLE